jgi:hypothetical protein
MNILATPRNFPIIASATAADGMESFAIVSGTIACGPLIGSTWISSSRASARSALYRASNASMSRVIRS